MPRKYRILQYLCKTSCLGSPHEGQQSVLAVSEPLHAITHPVDQWLNQYDHTETEAGTLKQASLASLRAVAL